MIERMKDWTLKYLDYRKLEELTRSEMDKGGLREGLYLLVLSQLLNMAALFVSFPIAVYFVPSPLALDQVAIALAKVSVLGIVVFYAVGLMMFLFSMLLGGKGKLESQLYILCLFTLCGRIVSTPFVILSAVDPISFLMLVMISVIGLYGLYAAFVALRTVHGFSSLRAAVALILSFAATLLVIGVLGIALGVPPA
ncbi:MAG TPA: YIP1 family protein [Candidatus Bilamarchaeum sp.]|nr:YIP1 family protein [Candidatus Bilamarchaeum sp.]